MKKEFNKSWKASKQPRKQRKFLANAPLSLRKKLLSTNLSKELRKKYGKRNFPLRKGDNVKIMNGKLKKRTGKINGVDLKTLRVVIEGIQIKKQDGSKANIRMHPSNLQIIELNLEDQKRKNSLEGKKETIQKKEIPKEKSKIMEKKK
jgi:large subunit ribosomal protein L24